MGRGNCVELLLAGAVPLGPQPWPRERGRVHGVYVSIKAGKPVAAVDYSRFWRSLTWRGVAWRVRRARRGVRGLGWGGRSCPVQSALDNSIVTVPESFLVLCMRSKYHASFGNKLVMDSSVPIGARTVEISFTFLRAFMTPLAA